MAFEHFHGGLAPSRVTATSHVLTQREDMQRGSESVVFPAQAEDPFSRHASLLLFLWAAGRILPLSRLSLATLHKTTPLQS